MDTFYHIFFISTAFYGLVLTNFFTVAHNIQSKLVLKALPFLIGMMALFAEIVHLGFLVQV